MSIQPVSVPSVLMLLFAACDRAISLGYRIRQGSPALVVRAGKYSPAFRQSKLDPMGAIILGTRTRTATYVEDGAMRDAAIVLGTSIQVVQWVNDGFDLTENAPTLENGFDAQAIAAFGIGEALRVRYLFTAN